MKGKKPLRKPGVTRREFFTNSAAGLVAAELAGASKAADKPAQTRPSPAGAPPVKPGTLELTSLDDGLDCPAPARVELVDAEDRGSRAIPLGAQIKSKVRLGLFSAVPKCWDLEGNWRTFERTVAEHANEGVDLIITPECYLDGYVVNAKDWNPQRFAMIAQDVETSSYIRRLKELAAKYNVYILFGFTENSAGKIYDSAIMVNRPGATVGIYHKTMLQFQDLRFSQGQELPVFATEWGKMGILICADRRWPESARVERLKGARIILIPSYGMWGLKNEWWMRTRSYENGNFLAFAHSRTAFVSDPRGEIVARLQTNLPVMLVCDVDLSQTNDTDVCDRRPELYGVICRPK